ncbi:MAG TPA: TIM-barrel domain-containing protein [Terriglobales bacterium]|nr:TIM-barrel domain-containing protein [Terriglobales bacterium]
MAGSRRDLLKGATVLGAGVFFGPRKLLGQALSAAPPLAPIVEVEVRTVSAKAVRLLLRRETGVEPGDDGAVALAKADHAAGRVQAGGGAKSVRSGELVVSVDWNPLRVRIRDRKGRNIQEIADDPETRQFKFALGEGPIFGLGEGGPQFSRRGVVDRMVSGSRGYRLGTNGSKVPIQWLMGGLPDGEAWGMFLHQPLGSFDLSGEEGVFTVAANEAQSRLGVAELFVAAGAPSALMGEYAAITGFPAMPPLWSLGYLQSHRTLGSPEEILAEAATFREKRLPCDAMIYLGTGFCPNGWNTANGSFDWNARAFPNPAAAVAALHHDNFKMVVHVVLDGHRLMGTVADACSDPQPPLPQVAERAIGCYWPFHRPLFDLGVDGWWPDEGDGYDAPSRLARNRMYFEGAQLYRPNQRVFALHRNGYAGMQRFASFLWSGDVQSTWATLRTQIAVGINAGMSGVPLWGTDIGGFVPTAEYTGELYARWFQFGAFCPLFRSHGRDWRLHLPWGWNTGTLGVPETQSYHPAEAELHNAAIEPVCRKYLELRYRLLPYLYSAVRESCDSGMPVIRGLWLHYPEDENAAGCADQYLFGRDLLIAPVFEAGAMSRKVYLPPGDWFDFWSNEKVQGGVTVERRVDLGTMPIYVRAGAILPLGAVLQHTGEAASEPLRLQVYPGADGTATFYQDDGASFDFRRGAYMKIAIAWHDRARHFALRLAPGSKMLPPSPRALVAQVMDSGREQALLFHGGPVDATLGK